jgi:hypothetical protein
MLHLASELTLVLHELKSRMTLAARLTGKTGAETISVMLALFGMSREVGRPRRGRIRLSLNAML